MKLHSTLGYEAAKAAYTEAYVAYDLLAERGVDTGPEREAVDAAEEAATIAYLLHPATTPKEVAEKLAVITERDIPSYWEPYPRFIAQIQADLHNMLRPNVSAPLEAAFAIFADAWNLLCTDTPGADEAAALSRNIGDAARLVMSVPCTTPGDFIVKAYVNLLTGTGGQPGAAFEISPAALEDAGTIDGAHERSVFEDIRASDLGCCLLSLGRTNFDADAWIAAAEFAGHDFSVVVDEAGKRSFCQGMFEQGDEDSVRDDRQARLMQLAAFDHSRVVAIVEAVVATRPERVVGLPREAVAA